MGGGRYLVVGHTLLTAATCHEPSYVPLTTYYLLRTSYSLLTTSLHQLRIEIGDALLRHARHLGLGLGVRVRVKPGSRPRSRAMAMAKGGVRGRGRVR